jgi:hypothetical protein
MKWDGAPEPAQQYRDYLVYCTHNMVTFPTWHRPYMLLFEVGVTLMLYDQISNACLLAIATDL